MQDQKIKLAKLHEYQTKDGRQYFRGFLGETVVLIFRDDYADVPDGCNGIWNLFLEPKQQRKDASQARATRNEPAALVSPSESAPAKLAPGVPHTAPKKRRASGNRPGYHKIDRKPPKGEVAADRSVIDDPISF